MNLCRAALLNGISETAMSRATCMKRKKSSAWDGQSRAIPSVSSIIRTVRYMLRFQKRPAHIRKTRSFQMIRSIF